MERVSLPWPKLRREEKVSVMYDRDRQSSLAGRCGGPPQATNPQLVIINFSSLPSHRPASARRSAPTLASLFIFFFLSPSPAAQLSLSPYPSTQSLPIHLSASSGIHGCTASLRCPQPSPSPPVKYSAGDPLDDGGLCHPGFGQNAEPMKAFHAHFILRHTSLVRRACSRLG
jgi:hypothetical protein